MLELTQNTRAMYYFNLFLYLCLKFTCFIFFVLLYRIVSLFYSTCVYSVFLDQASGCQNDNKCMHACTAFDKCQHSFSSIRITTVPQRQRNNAIV